MIDMKSRKFINDFKVIDDYILVSLGTGEKIALSLTDLDKVKNQIKKEIREIDSENDKITSNFKKRKMAIVLDCAIILGSILAYNLVRIPIGVIPKMIGLSLVVGTSAYAINANLTKIKDCKEQMADTTLVDKKIELSKNLKSNHVKQSVKAKTHSNDGISYSEEYTESLDKQDVKILRFKPVEK